VLLNGDGAGLRQIKGSSARVADRASSLRNVKRTMEGARRTGKWLGRSLRVELRALGRQYREGLPCSGTQKGLEWS
jgi:hypothetical protein